MAHERDWAVSQKRADREAGEGTVALAIKDALGAIVEIRCETDFVAKSPELRRPDEESRNCRRRVR